MYLKLYYPKALYLKHRQAKVVLGRCEVIVI